MKKETNLPYKIESLSELHRLLGLPKPLHPLISLVNNQDGSFKPSEGFPAQFILSFYKITYQPNLRGAGQVRAAPL